jgi:hypothetical protein
VGLSLYGLGCHGGGEGGGNDVRCVLECVFEYEPFRIFRRELETEGGFLDFL